MVRVKMMELEQQLAGKDFMLWHKDQIAQVEQTLKDAYPTQLSEAKEIQGMSQEDFIAQWQRRNEFAAKYKGTMNEKRNKDVEALQGELDKVHAELDEAKRNCRSEDQVHKDNAKLWADNAKYVQEIAELKKQLAAAKRLL